MVKKKPEQCLFCGDSPCSCDGGKPKKRTVKKRSEPPVAPPVSDLDFTIPDRQSRFKAKEKEERDLVFMNALRLLREIVSERDQRWIDSQLNPPYPQELDKRVSEWRAKHGRSSRPKRQD